ncbi:MAG: hypothetical protein QG661_626 [Actinomycetota bacterium]|nr:hypothetical protein [Actinomycetota bacterium]
MPASCLLHTGDPRPSDQQELRVRIHRVVVAAIAALALVVPAAPAVAAASITPDVVAVAAKARLAAPASAAAGSEVTFTLRFPSKARSFTVVTDWGDGTQPTTLQGSSPTTIKRTQLTHSFAGPGTFVVTVTVGRLQATRSIIITAAGAPSPEPAAEAWQVDMLARLNALRASLGAAAVRLCAPLNAAATKHSADMASRGYFDHTGLDGRDPSDRAAAEGYSSGVGENIAAGYDSVADVMAGWIDSPGHYANLINADYRVVGFGRVSVPDSPYGVYWTQNFGSRAC